MPPDGQLVPAIGYVRVSMMREEAISPETQKASIEDAARRRGRRIAEWVTDLDKTGRNFKRRIMKAIASVEAGGPREIIVWKYSRFGRNRTGVAVNLARLEKAGGELISATEDVDARTATGKFTRGMLFEVAAFESDRAGETWREAYRHRVGQGLPPVGRPRFGYRRLGRVRDEDDPHHTRREKGEEERYVPDPELGETLAGMYRSYTGGDGGPAIAGSLNRAAILNTYGKPWSGRTVLDVLDSGFGAGYLRLHAPDCTCGNATRCRNRVWVKGKHEAVINEDEWQAFRRRRKDAATTPARHRNPVYPVSGLVRCGHCGAAVVVSGAARAPGVRFVCSRYRNYGDCPGAPAVHLAALLAAVEAQLAELAGDLDPLAATTRPRVPAPRSAAGNADSFARELAAVDRKMVKLALRRIEDDHLPAGAWEDAAAELRAERARLEVALEAAKRAMTTVPADPLRVLTPVLQGWDTLPAAALNRMLRTIIGPIKVWSTGPAVRDERGHWLPQPVRIEVIPIWATGAT